MKKYIKIIIMCIMVAMLAFISGCSGDNKALEDKKEGVYLNYIDSAKTYHENKYKGINNFEYANVVYEKVASKVNAENIKDSLPVYECIVTFVVDNGGNKSLRNYLLKVSRGDFCTMVKRWTEEVTDYAKQQVDNQKYVEENSRTTKDNDLELNVKVKGVEVGGKVNIGAIMDDLRKNAEATFMTLESIKNDIMNKDITDEKLLLNMSEDTYYFAIAYYSKYFHPIIKEISTDEVLKAYDEIKDDENKNLYKKLLDKNKSKVNENVEIAKEIEQKNLYATYLEDNGINKKVKNETSKNYITKYYLNYYNLDVPNDFETNYYSNYPNVNYALVSYENEINNKKAEVILISNNSLEAYYDYNKLKSDMEDGLLKKEIEGVLSNLNIVDAKLDENVEEVSIPNSYGYLYTFMNDKKYGEALVFVDEAAKGYTYVLCLESLDGEYEHKNVFKNIRDSINKTKIINLTKESDKYVKDKLSPTEVESELRELGFKNITKIPTTEFEQNAPLNKIANLWEGFTRDFNGKHDTEILFKVEVDGDSAYKMGDYPENVPINVWFFSDAKFDEYKKEQENKKIEEEERIYLATSRQERLENADLMQEEESKMKADQEENDTKTFERQNKKVESGIIISDEAKVIDIKDDSIGKFTGLKIGDKVLRLFKDVNNEIETENAFRYVNDDGNSFNSYEEFLASESKKHELVGDKTDIYYVAVSRESKLSSEDLIFAVSFDEEYYENEYSGAIIYDKEGNWVVGFVDKNSTADIAGLKSDDIIKEMNGEELLGKAKTNQIVELREKAGNTDTLIVVRKEVEESTNEEIEKEYTVEIKY